MDIYKFQMPNEFEVAPTTFVEGFVLDSITKAPIETYIQTNLRGRVQTDKNGRFFFCLPAEKNLSIVVQENDYFPHQSKRLIPQWDNKSLYPVTIYLQPRPKIIPLTDTIITPLLKDTIPVKIDPIFHTVYFDFNDFGIHPIATKQLDKLMASLNIAVYKKVTIFGYADTSGASDYNLDLSKRRAKNVAQYLRLNGFEAATLVIQGKGENNQFDTNRLNRRVEIRFE